MRVILVVHAEVSAERWTFWWRWWIFRQRKEGWIQRGVQSPRWHLLQVWWDRTLGHGLQGTRYANITWCIFTNKGRCLFACLTETNETNSNLKYLWPLFCSPSSCSWRPASWRGAVWTAHPGGGCSGNRNTGYACWTSCLCTARCVYVTKQFDIFDHFFSLIFFLPQEESLFLTHVYHKSCSFDQVL